MLYINYAQTSSTTILTNYPGIPIFGHDKLSYTFKGMAFFYIKFLYINMLAQYFNTPI